MAKQGGSLAKGRRLLHEVPPQPGDAGMTALQRKAQAALIELVDESGGRFGTARPVAVGHVDVLSDLLNDWGRANSSRREGRRYFNGRPGLWQALDELCPLQDPNRWDGLRAAVIAELEARGWQRTAPPRGVSFFLPE